MHLLLATRNAHKTAEFAQILGGEFIVSDLRSLPDALEVEETGNTFEENADAESSRSVAADEDARRGR